MKKLILISALLFSFNGWAEEDIEIKTSFSLYFKYLSDISEDLHRCAEMYIAIYGYIFQNPESLFKTGTPEQWLVGGTKGKPSATAIAAIKGAEHFVGLKLDEVNKIFEGEIKAFKANIAGLKLEYLGANKPLSIPSR